MVREALVTSVTKRPLSFPPVRFYIWSSLLVQIVIYTFGLERGTYPNKPGVDCTKHQVARLVRFLNFGYMIQQPSQLASGKVSAQTQTSDLLDEVEARLLF